MRKEDLFIFSKRRQADKAACSDFSDEGRLGFFASRWVSSRGAGVIPPVVLRIQLGAIVPGIPFLFGEFVHDLTLFIENVGIFAKKKICNAFE